MKSKVLIFDLETAGVNSFKPDLSVVICFGYKWLGDAKAKVLTIDQFPGWFSSEKGLNDKGLLEAALKIMAEAEITVAHYGQKFDAPFFRGRCLLQGLEPPAPAKMRDTCYIAWKTFNFSSNRLQHLADILQLGQKKQHKECPEHWPNWWLKVLAGNRVALKEMAKYCAQDVETLEQVYMKLAPYDAAHPRMVDDRSRCKLCGGQVEYRGFTRSNENKYRRFQCLECGKWGRETKAVK